MDILWPETYVEHVLATGAGRANGPTLSRERSAPVTEERVLLAHRPNPVRVDVARNHALVVAGRGGDDLAQRVEDHRVTDIREAIAGADPVHTHDVGLVL